MNGPVIHCSRGTSATRRSECIHILPGPSSRQLQRAFETSLSSTKPIAQKSLTLAVALGLFTHQTLEAIYVCSNRDARHYSLRAWLKHRRRETHICRHAQCTQLLWDTSKKATTHHLKTDFSSGRSGARGLPLAGLVGSAWEIS